MPQDEQLLLRQLLRFALEAVAIQQKIIFDLINARAATEHLLRVVHPADHEVYQKALEQANHDAYQVQRTTMLEIEAKVDSIRALIEQLKKSHT